MSTHEWSWDEGPDWKQIRKNARLPHGSEDAIIEGYHYALEERAADLELAEAVRRLPNENLSIRHCPTDDEYEWCVAINAKGYKVGCGPTLIAAIEEALPE